MLLGVLSTTKVKPCFTSLYNFWSLMFCSGNIHQQKWLCSIECSWRTNVLRWLKKRNWQKVWYLLCGSVYTSYRINKICTIQRQIVRTLHWYCRGHGFESCSGLNFFLALFHNCLSCVCDDQSCLHFENCFKHPL